MNERQKKFAEYYAQCGNAAQSARQAGYSASYAEHRTDDLLRNVEISKYIRQLSEANQECRIMTAKERQETLSDIAKDIDNAPVDRIRAIDTLNKMTGEYTTKIQAKVNTSEKLADVFKQLGCDGLEE